MSDVFIEPVKSFRQKLILKKLSTISHELSDISTLIFGNPETAWFYRVSEELCAQVSRKAIDFDKKEMFVMVAFRKWAKAADGA